MRQAGARHFLLLSCEAAAASGEEDPAVPAVGRSEVDVDVDVDVDAVVGPGRTGQINCTFEELQIIGIAVLQFLSFPIPSIAILCLPIPKYCNSVFAKVLQYPSPPLRTVFCLQAVCPGLFYHSI